MASTKLEGMKTLLRDNPSSPISVIADHTGFHIRIKSQVLVTEGSRKKPSKARNYKNLTKAAHFLKDLGVESFTVDVKQLPPPPKRKNSKKADKSEAVATPAESTPVATPKPSTKPKGATAKSKTA